MRRETEMWLYLLTAVSAAATASTSASVSNTPSAGMRSRSGSGSAAGSVAGSGSNAYGVAQAAQRLAADAAESERELRKWLLSQVRVWMILSVPECLTTWLCAICCWAAGEPAVRYGGKLGACE